MAIDTVRLLLFPTMMAFAASSDLLTMTISNRVSLILLAGFFVLIGLALGVPVGSAIYWIAEASHAYLSGVSLLAAAWNTSIYGLLAATLATLMALPYLKLVGGLALLVIAAKLLVPEDENDEIAAGTTLWQAIRIVVIADIVMSLDNVIAVAAAANSRASAPESQAVRQTSRVFPFTSHTRNRSPPHPAAAIRAVSLLMNSPRITM